MEWMRKGTPKQQRHKVEWAKQASFGPGWGYNAAAEDKNEVQSLPLLGSEGVIASQLVNNFKRDTMTSFIGFYQVISGSWWSAAAWRCRAGARKITICIE